MSITNKIEDTRPKVRILLDYGDSATLAERFSVTPQTIRKYMRGLALTPEAKRDAKQVREYALTHLGACYDPKANK